MDTESNTKVELSKKILSPTINMLGDILGEVIQEQAGNEFFLIVEKVRLLAKDFRENGDMIPFNELALLIQEYNDEEKIIIIKSFSLFFQLVNLAEENYKIRVNSELSILELSEDTIKFCIEYIDKHNVGYDELIVLINNLHLKLVWTAHPTEARRLTNLIKLREIYDLIPRILICEEGAYGYSEIRLKIKEKITIIWQSDDLRENKVSILDEVRTNLFYFDNTVFEVLPNLLHELKTAIANKFPSSNVKLPNFIEFGSWVGGDRDGHSGVTAKVTIQTILLQKRLCLRKYLTSVRILIQDISSSINQTKISKELEISIENDSKIFTVFSSKTKKLNQLELYRRKLDFIRLKIINTLENVEDKAEQVGLGRTLVASDTSTQLVQSSNHYIHPNDFLEDLLLIDNSLRQNKGDIIANGRLSLLITKVRIFGFHLAPLDIRQHAEVHNNAIDDIFHYIDLPKYTELDKKGKIKILLDELKNNRPLGITSYFESYSETTKELISTMNVIRDSLNTISSRAIESYIISMARNEADIYLLLLLLKETKLVVIDDNKVSSASLDLVPLFETRDDLLNSAMVMDNLFSNTLYRSLISIRGDIQEVMIGYSDSTKDVGYLLSNYRLIVAQQELVKVAEKHKIQLKIFHGRGGSISRGGGPTHKAVLSQPPGTVFKTKITQQGEVIGWNYSNPEIGRRHLEQIISSMITRSINDTKLLEAKNPAYLSKENMYNFELLAEYSGRYYEKLVKNNSDFIKFYMEFTPLDVIERATIGSRPSRRTKSDVQNIESLRAIPWIFSWMQTRLIFTTYYGVGSAFKEFEEKNEFSILVNLYQTWPYFTSLIDNLQMICLKVDLQIAEQYLKLSNSKNGKEMFQVIKDEYNRTVNYILLISTSKSLMEKTPDIQNSIKRRNPYIDPLSLIQIDLLQTWREMQNDEETNNLETLRQLLQTVNGIAAGLRNTG